MIPFPCLVLDFKIYIGLMLAIHVAVSRSDEVFADMKPKKGRRIR
jgi:hypothetical protein